MGGRVLAGALTAATVLAASPSWAGGGFHGGGVRLPAGHPTFGGARMSGGWHGGGSRPMPPVAGVIHERPGSRPYYSAYGHVGTAYVPFGGSRRAGYDRGGYDRGGYDRGGYGFGHVATGWGYGRVGLAGRPEGDRWFGGRRVRIERFGRENRGYGRYAGYGGYGAYGGYGYDTGGYGGGLAGIYGSQGYGVPGTYGAPGTYGTPGTYGGYGTEAGVGGAYLSEQPLAATRAESPLAPSPYGPDGGYYARGRGAAAPHIITIDRATEGCGCRPASYAYPAIYRYGVGTAY